MNSNTTSSHFEGEGRSARFLRLQEAILPPYASLLCHSESAYQPCLNGIPNRVFMNLKLFFFFSGALDPDLVLQWSVQWPSDITILNRAGVQWLCRATPEGGYTSTPKSPRNRTWPPGNVPRPTGHLSSRAC